MLRHCAALVFAVLACSSCSTPPEVIDAGVEVPDSGTEADAGVEVPDAGSTAAPIPWTACPLHSEGGSMVMGECATVPLPLRAGQADGGPMIDVFVKRWSAPNSTKQRQVWMLMGGPGGSGMGYESVAEQIGTKFTDLEFYIPDHRGTGRSTRLGCPMQEKALSAGGSQIVASEWPDCLTSVMTNHPGAIGAYSTTNAANDLGLLIEQARNPSQTVFVYGASYGTYWAHRYLQLFPRQADGVILDSMVSPSLATLAEQDVDANEAGRAFFDTICKSDTACAAKLGTDPWAFAEATFAKLKTGHCAAPAQPYGAPMHLLLRRVFGSMMMGFGLRPYMAAAIYRADRCNAADSAALSKLLQLYFGSPPSAAASTLYALWGWVLSNNILFSEMWSEPSVTPQQLLAWREESVVSRDVTSSMDSLVGSWPVYPKDQYVGQWAATDVPMLMLAGGLDPATIIRKQLLVKPHFTAANQTWVEFPLGAHGVISSSPTNAGFSCGTAVMMSFIRSPKTPVDTSCKADLKGLDFAGSATPQTTMDLFGTADRYE